MSSFETIKISIQTWNWNLRNKDESLGYSEAPFLFRKSVKFGPSVSKFSHVFQIKVCFVWILSFFSPLKIELLFYPDTFIHLPDMFGKQKSQWNFSNFSPTLNSIRMLMGLAFFPGQVSCCWHFILTYFLCKIVCSDKWRRYW